MPQRVQYQGKTYVFEDNWTPGDIDNFLRETDTSLDGRRSPPSPAEGAAMPPPPPPTGAQVATMAAHDNTATLLAKMGVVRQPDPTWGGQPRQMPSAPPRPSPPEDVVAPSRPFETPLPRRLVPIFEAWKRAYAPNDSGEDYDLQGAFLAGAEPNRETGHWPDTFKKPNHPTFSDQSVYAQARPDLAGHWNGDEYIPPQPRPRALATGIGPPPAPRIGGPELLQRGAGFRQTMAPVSGEGRRQWPGIGELLDEPTAASVLARLGSSMPGVGGTIERAVSNSKVALALTGAHLVGALDRGLDFITDSNSPEFLSRLQSIGEEYAREQQRLARPQSQSRPKQVLGAVLEAPAGLAAPVVASAIIKNPTVAFAIIEGVGAYGAGEPMETVALKAAEGAAVGKAFGALHEVPMRASVPAMMNIGAVQAAAHGGDPLASAVAMGALGLHLPRRLPGEALAIPADTARPLMRRPGSAMKLPETAQAGPGEAKPPEAMPPSPTGPPGAPGAPETLPGEPMPPSRTEPAGVVSAFKAREEATANIKNALADKDKDLPLQLQRVVSLLRENKELPEELLHLRDEGTTLVKAERDRAFELLDVPQSETAGLSPYERAVWEAIHQLKAEAPNGGGRPEQGTEKSGAGTPEGRPGTTENRTGQVVPEVPGVVPQEPGTTPGEAPPTEAGTPSYEYPKLKPHVEGEPYAPHNFDSESARFVLQERDNAEPAVEPLREEAARLGFSLGMEGWAQTVLGAKDPSEAIEHIISDRRVTAEQRDRIETLQSRPDMNVAPPSEMDWLPGQYGEAETWRAIEKHALDKKLTPRQQEIIEAVGREDARRGMQPALREAEQAARAGNEEARRFIEEWDIADQAPDSDLGDFNQRVTDLLYPPLESRVSERPGKPFGRRPKAPTAPTEHGQVEGRSIGPDGYEVYVGGKDSIPPPPLPIPSTTRVVASGDLPSNAQKLMPGVKAVEVRQVNRVPTRLMIHFLEGVGQKLLQVVSNLPKGRFGQVRGGRIQISSDLGKANLEILGEVLAHEIGHLPISGNLTRHGNIFERIAAIQNYGKRILATVLGEKLPDKGEMAKHYAAVRGIAAQALGYPDWNAVIKGKRQETTVQGVKVQVGGLEPVPKAEREAAYQKALYEYGEAHGLVFKENALEELKALSFLRRPIPENASRQYRKYRLRQAELYADAMSALWNDPETALKMAPNFFRAWFGHLDAKPEYRAAYEEIQGLLDQANKGQLDLDRYMAEMDLRAQEIKLIEQKQAADKILGGIESFSDEVVNWVKAAVRQLREGLSNEDLAAYKATRPKGEGDFALLDANAWAEKVSVPYMASPIQLWMHELFMATRKASTLEKLQAFADKRGISVASIFGEFLEKRRIAGEREPRGLLSPKAQTSADWVALRKIMEEEGILKDVEEWSESWWKLDQEIFQPILEAGGLVSKENLAYIKANQNYARFQNHEMALEKLSWWADARKNFNMLGDQLRKPQKGTLSAVAPAFAQTVAYKVQLMWASAFNLARLKLSNQLQKTMPEGTLWARAEQRGGRAKPAPEGMVLFDYMRDGKRERIYVNKEIADCYERKMQSASAFVHLLEVTQKPIKLAWVQLSGKWLVRNLLRDPSRTGQIPGIVYPLLGSLRAMVSPEVRRFVLHGEATGEVRRMILNREIHPNPEEAFTGLQRADHPALRQMEMLTKVLGSEGPFFREETRGERFGRRLKTGAFALAAASEIGGKLGGRRAFMRARLGKEAYEAVQAGEAEMTKDFAANLRYHMQNRISTPNAYIRGNWHNFTNNVMPYSNMAKEDFRTTFEQMRENPGNFFAKVATKKLPITLAQYAIKYGWAAGAVAAALGYDDDKEEDRKLLMQNPLYRSVKGWEAVYRRIPDYYFTTGIVAPLPILSGPKGAEKAVFLHLPGSQALSGLNGELWAVARTVQKDDWRGLAHYQVSQLPWASLGPPTEMVVMSAFAAMSPQLPYDTFRQRAIIPQAYWDLGALEHVRYTAAYEMKDLSGQVLPIIDTDGNLPSTKEWVNKWVFGQGMGSGAEWAARAPVVSSVVGGLLKVSDSGLREEAELGAAALRKGKAEASKDLYTTLKEIAQEPEATEYSALDKLRAAGFQWNRQQVDDIKRKFYQFRAQSTKDKLMIGARSNQERELLRQTWADEQLPDWYRAGGP